MANPRQDCCIAIPADYSRWATNCCMTHSIARRSGSGFLRLSGLRFFLAIEQNLHRLSVGRRIETESFPYQPSNIFCVGAVLKGAFRKIISLGPGLMASRVSNFGTSEQKRKPATW
jgi:hypothetical protein